MTDLKPPFWVKLHDPSRTFYDMATGLYIAQDQVQKVTTLSAFIKDALHAGGLVHCAAPDDTSSEDGDQQIGAGTSTQETTEEDSDTSEGTEEESDTTEDQQDASSETQEEEEDQEEEEPKKELSLKDIQKLGKTKKR